MVGWCWTSGNSYSRKPWKSLSVSRKIYLFPGQRTPRTTRGHQVLTNFTTIESWKTKLLWASFKRRLHIFLCNGLRSKGQDIIAGFGPVKMYRSSIFQLPCLNYQKKITPPWVVSCTHRDSKAMSGSGSACGIRSAIALPAWESQKVNMSTCWYKKRHWLKKLSSHK